jgi:hypothetical protein
MAGQAGKRRRVLRGGSFNNNDASRNARAAYRNNTPDNEWNNNGFRCGVSVGVPCLSAFDGIRAYALLPRPAMRCVHGHGAEAEL